MNVSREVYLRSARNHSPNNVLLTSLTVGICLFLRTTKMDCKAFIRHCKSRIKSNLMVVIFSSSVVQFNVSTFCLKTAKMILSVV
jgi:hypothetical protein